MSGRIFPQTVLIPALSILSLATVATGSLRGPAWQGGASQDQSPPDTQSQSIAEAARRSREGVKNTTKTSKVITDDDLDKNNVKPGAQGLTVDAPAKLETQPPTSEAVAAAATSNVSNTDAATAPAPSDDPEIAKLKNSITDMEKEADLLNRDLALQQDTYLSNADHAHDIAGQAKLDALQQEINNKRQDIDRLKTRLAALQELHPIPPPTKSVEQPAAPPKP